jgi:hypothetical protein
MSVRKRTWKTAKGEAKEAWVVTYSNQNKKGHLKTFRRKKDADAYWAQVQVAVKEGLHTPDSQSVTVREAGFRWLKNSETRNLERTTVEQSSRGPGPCSRLIVPKRRASDMILVPQPKQPNSTPGKKPPAPSQSPERPDACGAKIGRKAA